MMAFQYYYHWSQTEFYEHTRGRSGIGEGVYVSYIFVWLWLGDAAWWWIAPLQYARRAPWLHRVLHAFMLFIVFNGMVVYETGFSRWAGIVMFSLLAALWLRTRIRPRH